MLERAIVAFKKTLEEITSAFFKKVSSGSLKFADEDEGIGEREGDGGSVGDGDVCRGGGVVDCRGSNVVDKAVIEILRKSVL